MICFKMFYDNIFVFRHIRFPNVTIEKPKHIINIINKSESKEYKYGCNIVPSKEELVSNLLGYRVFENEGETLSFHDFNPLNYEIKVDGKHVFPPNHRQTSSTKG